MEGICHILANSCWEMLLKTIGQPLGTATVKQYRKALLGSDRRLLDSLWAILKGYWKAIRKYPNTLRPNEHMLLLAGSDEQSGK
jgi:hypothetical protein